MKKATVASNDRKIVEWIYNRLKQYDYEDLSTTEKYIWIVVRDSVELNKILSKEEKV